MLEAFSSGIPVVVPRTQGFCDTVTHEVDGFLFEPGDSSSAKSYILRLKENTKLCSKMGRSGQKNVSSRTVQAVNDDLIKWYLKGIDNFRNRSLVRSIVMTLLVLFGVPFTMICLGGYQWVVWMLGIAPKKKKKRKGTN